MATHLVNWLSPFKERVTTVTGELRLLRRRHAHRRPDASTRTAREPAQWDRVAAFRGVAEGDMIRYAIPKPEPLLTELANFAAAVRGEPDAHVVTLEEGLATVRIAEALRDSAASGTSIRIDAVKVAA